MELCHFPDVFHVPSALLSAMGDEGSQPLACMGVPVQPVYPCGGNHFVSRCIAGKPLRGE